jgi:hypothetical protein
MAITCTIWYDDHLALILSLMSYDNICVGSKPKMSIEDSLILYVEDIR